MSKLTSLLSASGPTTPEKPPILVGFVSTATPSSLDFVASPSIIWWGWPWWLWDWLWWTWRWEIFRCCFEIVTEMLMNNGSDEDDDDQSRREKKRWRMRWFWWKVRSQPAPLVLPPSSALGERGQKQTPGLAKENYHHNSNDNNSMQNQTLKFFLQVCESLIV